MSRWVRISASIFETEAFGQSPFSEREAWIWMIVNAAWKETTHRVGNSVVTVPVGSFYTTLRGLRDAWNWGSDTRVRTFLGILKTERMIITEANAGKTQISICNYKKYQCVGYEEQGQETQEKRTENAARTHRKRTKDTNTPIHTDISSSEEIGIVPFEAEKSAFDAFAEAVRGTPIPEPKKLTRDRSAKLKQRLSEHGMDGWHEACRKVAASDFCRGRNEKGWVADFDFLLQPSSLNKLLEGRYDNRVSIMPNEKPRERTPLDVLKERIANVADYGSPIEYVRRAGERDTPIVLLNAVPQGR